MRFGQGQTCDYKTHSSFVPPTVHNKTIAQQHLTYLSKLVSPYVMIVGIIDRNKERIFDNEKSLTVSHKLSKLKVPPSAPRGARCAAQSRQSIQCTRSNLHQIAVCTLLCLLLVLIHLDLSVIEAICEGSKLNNSQMIHREIDHNNTQLARNLTDRQHSSDQSMINISHPEPLNSNSLRLEYFKFKILSNLGITTDPDEIKPNLDEDLRQKLAQTKALKEVGGQDSGYSSRHKRSLSCSQVMSNKDACCVETFYVNFTEIGWDKWILYPSGYNANYCRGKCDLSHARYYHSTLLSKFSNVIGLCCSPRQMAPLHLLYIDEDNKVHQKTMADMIVESCDCA